MSFENQKIVTEETFATRYYWSYSQFVITYQNSKWLITSLNVSCFSCHCWNCVTSQQPFPIYRLVPITWITLITPTPFWKIKTKQSLANLNMVSISDKSYFGIRYLSYIHIYILSTWYIVYPFSISKMQNVVARLMVFLGGVLGTVPMI